MQFLFRSPSMPTYDTALPGRSDPMPLTDRHFVNGASLKGPWADGTRTAIFALGCFWGAEKDFWQTPGVISTAVGYAGGYTPNADYREVGSGKTGHAEAVLVAYDPAKVSYEQLLKVFWEHHDPTQGNRQGNDMGTQYRSVILTADAEQQASAEASRDAYQERLSAAGFGQITTEIAPAGPFYYAEDSDLKDRTQPDPPNTFYYAEDYHQQYLAKNPNGYCPNHSTGVTFPDVVVTPLQYVD